MSLPRIKTADDLFAINDRPTEELDVPEWGGSVIVRPLDARTISNIAKATQAADGTIENAEYSARVILEGMVEPKLEPHHLEKLKERNNAAYLRVFNAIHNKKKEVSPS